jgi:hypothetical protein
VWRSRLSLGVAGGVTLAAEDSPTTGAASPATGAEESPTTGESAKMGKEEGTHTGAGQGVTPEHDTSKIDQPTRKSPYTTGGETPTEQPATGDQTGQ